MPPYGLLPPFPYMLLLPHPYRLLAPFLPVGSQGPPTYGILVPSPHTKRLLVTPLPYWVALPSLKNVCQWAFWPHSVLLMLAHCLKCFYFEWKNEICSGSKLILNPISLIFYPPLGGGWVGQKQMWMNPPFLTLIFWLFQ